MVQLSALHLCSVLSIIGHIATARVAPAPQATITPFPRSPWAPDSPYYGILRRDDKDKDKDKPQTSVVTADFKNFCGFADNKALPTCGGGGSCQSSGNFLGCGKKDEDVMTACYGDDSDDVDTDDKQALFCGSAGKKKRDDKSSVCLAMTAGSGDDAMTTFSCTEGKESTTTSFDTTMVVTATSTSTSSSSSSTTSDSTTASSTTASTSTSTASSTSATATPTPSAAPAGDGPTVPKWGIALAVIGSVLGAVALILIIYHCISSKVHPDDDNDSQPLVESKQWKGPWQGRGAE